MVFKVSLEGNAPMGFKVSLEGNAPSFPSVGLAAEPSVETTERIPPASVRRISGLNHRWKRRSVSLQR